MRLAILLLAALLVACTAPQPPGSVSDVEITKPMPGMHMSAGFLTITNRTDERSGSRVSTARSSRVSRFMKRL